MPKSIQDQKKAITEAIIEHYGLDKYKVMSAAGYVDVDPSGSGSVPMVSVTLYADPALFVLIARKLDIRRADEP